MFSNDPVVEGMPGSAFLSSIFFDVGSQPTDRLGVTLETAREPQY